MSFTAFFEVIQLFLLCPFKNNNNKTSWRNLRTFPLPKEEQLKTQEDECIFYKNLRAAKLSLWGGNGDQNKNLVSVF